MAYDTFESLSIKLCTVLEDIGVTEELINFRRYICTLSEVLRPLSMASVDGIEQVCASKPGMNQVHVFGSQMEGSTTLGMHSDYDSLTYPDTAAVYTDLSDCQPSKVSYLAIKTTMSCPQFYSLHRVMQISGKERVLANVFDFSLKKLNENLHIIDEEDRVLLSSNVITDCVARIYPKMFPNSKIEQHGPATTWVGKYVHEYVLALHCTKMPHVCQVLFSRPKPGHWPKQVTITKAKQFGVFFMHPGNIGHTFSYKAEHKKAFINIQYRSNIASRQWRVSTNKIELLLMCDLEIVQMKAYILTKMIRTQFLKPIVDDQLSTFHMKTALLFTVEKYPMEIWNNENLVNCVLFCLKTLRRFMQRRYCPHYFIASVNLFAGKLKVSEFPLLIKELTKMIDSGLQCVYTLSMDCVGERLKSFQATPTITLISREEYCSMTKSLLANIFRDPFKEAIIMSDYALKLTTHKFETKMKQFAQIVKKAISNRKDYSFELEFFYEILTNTVATTEASTHIADKKPITNDIHEMYKHSLRSGQISNYLKYASLLVCIHDYDQAVDLLKYIESRISPDMVQLSMIWETKPVIFKSSTNLTPIEVFKVFAANIINDVEFTRFEINCAPSHLIYEMYRTLMAGDDRMGYEGQWKEFAVVDAKPFLYYLQYLAHRDNEGKNAAKEKLVNYCISMQDAPFMGYLETACNLLGHVLELENKASQALLVYINSAKFAPHNNAAYWHMCRLISQYMADKSPHEMSHSDPHLHING